MDINLVKVFVAIILAVIGWLVGHWFTSKRAVEAKRRELVTTYLIDVYRKLDRFAVCLINGEATKECADNINSAITDIQLFGSERQIDYAIKISELMVNESAVPNKELIDLIQSLRGDLRKELGLPATDRNIAHLHAQSRDKENNA